MNGNRIYEESKERDYNINYGRVQNNNSKKYSDVKLLTGIISVGLLGFYLWKNVLKPVAKVVKSVIDVIDPEPIQTNSRIFHDNSRIFDGQVRRLSKKEADAIKNDGTIIEADYVINE